MQRSASPGPVPTGGSKRRMFRSRRDDPTFDDPRLESMVAASHRLMMQRLEEGLHAIEEAAAALMRQVADEIWEVTSPDGKDIQSRILETLSRDQAIRGLIAHSDERFQALDMKVGRIEGTLGSVDEAAKRLRQLIDEGQVEGAFTPPGFQTLDERVVSIEETLAGVNRTTQDLRTHMQHAISVIEGTVGAGGEESAGTVVNSDSGDIRERLNALQAYLMSVVEYLGDRDRAVVDWLRTTTRHTNAVTRAEVGRLVQAMEGRLGGRTAESETAVRDAVALHIQSVHDRIEQQARMFGEGLAEGLAVLEAKTLARLDGQAARLEDVAAELAEVRGAARAATEFVTAALHMRLDELTEQLQVDTTEIRRLVHERAAVAGNAAVRDLDERLARLSELVSAAMGWTVDRIGERIEQETLRSVEVGMADLVAAVDRRFVGLDRSLDEREGRLLRVMTERVDQAAGTVGERVQHMDRAMRAGLGAMEESVAERTTHAVGETLEAALRPVAAQLGEATRAITEGAARLEVTGQHLPDSVSRIMDERIASLARLIRSDNEALAKRLEVVEQQAAAKEAIRAINELSAALPGEIGAALDARIEILAELLRRESRSTADVVAKVGGALADRFDRTAARIGERFDRDVEQVVDQLGDTMANLATGLQRATPGRTRQG